MGVFRCVWVCVYVGVCVGVCVYVCVWECILWSDSHESSPLSHFTLSSVEVPNLHGRFAPPQLESKVAKYKFELKATMNAIQPSSSHLHNINEMPVNASFAKRKLSLLLNCAQVSQYLIWT